MEESPQHPSPNDALLCDNIGDVTPLIPTDGMVLTTETNTNQ